ncbi:MAG: NUDIX domain-containing protein [Thermoprotei archaeon]
MCLSKDGKVLLHRRAQGPLAGYVGLPGGKVEFGESALQAGLRELEEETGLVAEDARVAGVYTVVNVVEDQPDGHYILFVVSAHSYSGALIQRTIEGENFWAAQSSVSEVQQALPDLFYVLEMVEKHPVFIGHMLRYNVGGRLKVVTADGKEYDSTRS